MVTVDLADVDKFHVLVVCVPAWLTKVVDEKLAIRWHPVWLARHHNQTRVRQLLTIHVAFSPSPHRRPIRSIP